MRRALLAAVAGGALVALAACGNDANNASTTADQAPTAPSPTAESTFHAPDYTANSKQVCDKVAAIYQDGFAGFSTQLGKMIANKEAKQAGSAEVARKAAGEELKKVGAQIKKEVAAAEDPDLKAAGTASAAKVTGSATDKAFFDSIKTTKDLDARIESKMLDWMNPVTGYCA
ncbi:hypothetical protein [Actinoplanes sp. NBRC 103695]|uniref:hypothetical protein n=1 Tax=Actinoplanes sp. NBRC 103695 TaxID=3032202 RepID=UPI0024A4368F|nr:hypothetical protein [Actinoplanes sp. NBRC 103695]GLY96995.1 hypothetical protein Acsp02_42490 [Actinoplanes sp. NBRC 103695]